MDVATYARGVLALLDAKSLGVGFGQAADFIQPVLELERYLGATKRSIEGANVAALASGYNTATGVTVPNNETWVLRGASANLGAAAASTLQSGALATRMPGSTVFAIIGDPSGALAASTSNWTVLSAYDLVLVPGQSVGVAASGVVGTIAAEIILLVDRLRC